jgi:hypothetical protein
MFFTEQRSRLVRDVEYAACGGIIQRTTAVRPRNRAAVRVSLDISALPTPPGQRVVLQWSLMPTS